MHACVCFSPYLNPNSFIQAAAFCVAEAAQAFVLFRAE